MKQKVVEKVECFQRWFKHATRRVLFLAIGLFYVLLVGTSFNHVFASSPYQASDVLGQSDPSGNPLYTTADTNNTRLPDSGGLGTPSDVVVDNVHHEMYVIDTGIDAILVYNLDSTNHIASRQPTYILGQSSFTSSRVNATTSTGLYNPSGLAIDAAGQRLFVADSSNNRVIVFDLSNLSSGMAASSVLGQSNFTSNSVSATQAGMNEPVNVAYDSVNNRLFVGDSLNLRVLVFSVSTITNGQNATNVIGKPSFASSNNCGISATNTCLTDGLAYDNVHQRLFVSTDYRVLVFNVSSITNGMAASNILGEPNFSSSSQSITQSGFLTPMNLAYDSTLNRLFVSDGDRILIFSTSSITNGENASNIIGQTDYTSSLTTTTQNHIRGAAGLAYDSTTGILYVADSGDDRVDFFNGNPITNGENATDEIGQTDQYGADRWTSYSWGGSHPNPGGYYAPADTITDTVKHRLFVVDQNNARILVYNLDSNNNLVNHTPVNVLGQTDFYAIGGATSQSNLSCPFGLAYDTSRNWLYVSDQCDNRVLAYDVSNITNGEPALYVLGQPDFTTKTAPLTGTGTPSSLESPQGIAYDNVHKRLFVTDFEDSRIMIFDMKNPVNGEAASNELGQTGLTNTSLSNAPTASGLTYPEGVAYDSENNRIYVADAFNNRVLVFNADNLSNGMDASYVIGQSDFVSSDSLYPSASQNQFGSPYEIAFDSNNQRLLVTSGDGLYLFDTKNLQNNMNASAIIGEPDFSTTSDGLSQALSDYISNVYEDPSNANIYVTDTFNDRILIFNTVHITSSALSTGTVGTSYADQVTSSGSQGTLAMAVTAGSLPPGLSMTTKGIIAGTPTTSGTFIFTITASDDNGPSGVITSSSNQSITINEQTSQKSPQSPASQKTTDTTTSSTSSTPSSGSTTPVALLNDTPTFDTTGVTQELTTGQDVAFTIPDTGTASSGSSEGTLSATEVHHATVNYVGSNYVDLTIASNPIHLRLFVGQTENVDVNGDGAKDLSVELAGIINGKARLVFTNLASSSTGAASNSSAPKLINKSAIEHTQSHKRTSKFLISVVAVIIFGLIVTVVFLKKRRTT